MPYIDPAFRDALNTGKRPVNAGELNYNLTRIIKSGMVHAELVEALAQECFRYLGDEPRYGTYNDVIGAIVCCLHEYARRHPAEGDVQDDWADEVRGAILGRIFARLDPYEDKKRLANGDVL